MGSLVLLGVVQALTWSQLTLKGWEERLELIAWQGLLLGFLWHHPEKEIKRSADYLVIMWQDAGSAFHSSFTVSSGDGVPVLSMVFGVKLEWKCLAGSVAQSCQLFAPFGL